MVVSLPAVGTKQTIPSSPTAAIKAAMAKEAPEADGRRARSMASRSRIIEAMVELIEEGDPNPSAAKAAQKAGIALRSVYRLFEDKESIVREINEWIVRVYYPIVTAPFVSPDWQEQLFELVERRCAVFEAVVVFRVSSIAGRYSSPYIRETYEQLVQLEKRILTQVLPDDINTGTANGRAILLATTFDTWRFLRQDEGLSEEQTVVAIKEQVAEILARVER